VRRELGAKLRFTDSPGLRLTAFVTNTGRVQLPNLELCHLRRAHCEGRHPGSQRHRSGQPTSASIPPKPHLLLARAILPPLAIWLQMLT
jgi:hypothetical protein